MEVKLGIKKGDKIYYDLVEEENTVFLTIEIKSLMAGILIAFNDFNNENSIKKLKATEADLQNGGCLIFSRGLLFKTEMRKIYEDSLIWLCREQHNKLNNLESNNIIEEEGLKFKASVIRYNFILSNLQVNYPALFLESEFMESDFTKAKIEAIFLNEKNNPLLLEYKIIHVNKSDESASNVPFMMKIKSINSDEHFL